jgi:hypothetical protein
MSDLSDRSERLAWSTYLVSILLLVFPLVDLFTAAWPINVKAVAWRFGAVGLLSGGLVTPTLGVLLSLIVSVLADYKVVTRIIAILSLIAAVLIIIMMPLFILDALQMRSRVQAPAMTRFMLASGLAFMKLGGLAVATIVMGIAGFKASRSRSGDRKVTVGARQGTPPLAVGAAATPSRAES